MANGRPDTCENVIFFFRAQIDQEYKVSGVAFSDNAPSFYNQKLEKLKSELSLGALENTAREKGLRNYSIIVPVYYMNKAFTCNSNINQHWKSMGLTTFNRQNINGLCLFLDEVSVMLGAFNQ
jgi:hypothetical protein